MEDSLWFFTLLLLLISLRVLRHYLNKSPVNPRLPPGPPKLPFIGNLHQLASNTHTPLHRYFRDLARVHGPIMHLRLGELSTVVISSADVAKEVLKTHDAKIANRPRLMVGEILYNGFSDIGLAPYGEYWRQVRKIASLELFTVKRVQSFRYIREEEVSKMMKSLSLEGSNGSVVNLTDKFFHLIFNITSRTVFSRAGEDEDVFREFLVNLSNALTGPSIADIYPSFKFLKSITGMKRMLQKMNLESDKILDPIIKEHSSKERKILIGEDHSKEDFVDILLKFRDNDGTNNLPFSLTTNNIKSIILEIFGAGIDTTFATIEWAMAELIKSPKHMKRAQTELREIFHAKGTLDEGSLHEAKFLKLVIKETLRLHPPTPLLIPRESIETCEIQGYVIPPKTQVFVNAWAIGTDPKYWDDPDSFNPERFEGSSIDYKGTNYEFIPFGAGRRMCPGMTLGMASMELPLAMLLCLFDWKLPAEMNNEDLNMDEVFGVAVRRKNQLLVIPVPFSSSSTL